MIERKEPMRPLFVANVSCLSAPFVSAQWWSYRTRRFRAQPIAPWIFAAGSGASPSWSAHRFGRQMSASGKMTGQCREREARGEQQKADSFFVRV
jgi:hypothetical protein